MPDPRDEGLDEPAAVVGSDSPAAAPKPRRKRGIRAAPTKKQKALDESAAVPLHLRPVLTYAELDALGIMPQRTMRRLVVTGRVKRSVLRVGRSVRFVVQDLLDELRQAQE